MRRTRVLLAMAGVVLIAVGARKLLDIGSANTVATGRWLIGGVVLHDFVLTPVVLVAGALLVRAAAPWLRRPLIVGSVVLGTVTVVAIPMLGKYGARRDNPTLLDRNYVAGWFVLAAVVTVAVAVAALGARYRDGKRAGAGAARSGPDSAEEESAMGGRAARGPQPS